MTPDAPDRARNARFRSGEGPTEPFDDLDDGLGVDLRHRLEIEFPDGRLDVGADVGREQHDRLVEPPGPQLAGTHTQPVPIDLEVARFELALELHVLEQRIEAELNYNTALFDQATAQRLAGDFESVLRALTADPQTRLLGVQLPSEQAQGGAGSSARGPAGAGTAIRRSRRAGVQRR